MNQPKVTVRAHDQKDKDAAEVFEGVLNMLLEKLGEEEIDRLAEELLLGKGQKELLLELKELLGKEEADG